MCRGFGSMEKERRLFAVIMFIILILLLVWFGLELAGVFNPPQWKPDVEYPMTNANISWLETYYFGPWEG